MLALPAVVLHRFQLFHRWPAPVFLPEAVSFPRRHSIRCHLADQLRQAECIEITPIQVGVQRCHTLLFRVQPQGGVCRLGALPEKFRQVARKILEQVLPEKLTFRQSAVGLRPDIVPQRQQGFTLDRKDILRVQVRIRPCCYDFPHGEAAPEHGQRFTHFENAVPQHCDLAVLQLALVPGLQRKRCHRQIHIVAQNALCRRKIGKQVRFLRRTDNACNA